MKRLYRLLLLLSLGGSSALCGATISQGEYYIDTDPGPGNGTAFGIASSANVSQVVDVPANAIAALPEGVHSLVARVRDGDGDWSVAQAFPFYRFDPVAVAAAGRIVAAEYYIDADPGPGNGTPIALSAGGTVSQAVAVPAGAIAALPDGVHSLVCRVRDAEGDWSIAQAFPFYRFDPETAVERLVSQVTYQWFQNNAPVSSEYVLEVDPAAGFVSFDRLASLGGLQEGGEYQLVFTPWDSAGTRGISATREVLVQTVDTNGDGIPDQWKVTHGYGIHENIASLDDDNDGLSALEEFLAGTNPRLRDTDGDGLDDYAERGMAALGFNPTLAQPDLVAAYFDTAPATGLYDREQIGYLAIGQPVLERGEEGAFRINLQLEGSTTLSDFTRLPIDPAKIGYPGDGTMNYTFTPPGDKYFLILKAK